MRSCLSIIFVVVLSLGLKGQTLGGYALSDYLVSTVYANTCYLDAFVIGEPNDSLWVNFTPGDSLLGYFGSVWNDHPGPDILFETGYHGDNYVVKLLLSTGLYSTTNFVNVSDWSVLSNLNWKYRTSFCAEDSSINASHFILPLDFSSDFGLSAGDFVVGVHLQLLTTPGGPDFAGAYIISPPCSNSSSQISIDTCGTYTSPSGNYTWDTSGSYIDTIPNAEGCDSILYIGLIVNDNVNAGISLISGTEISADMAGASYQWLNCPDLTPIIDATNQSYMATVNGDYAVIVSFEGCVDTSECITVSQAVGISEHESLIFSIYPNPNTGQVNIVFQEFQEYVTIVITDVSGREIYSAMTSGEAIQFACDGTAGLYYLKINSGNKTLTKRLIME